jgi:hypothetical protein
MLTVSLGAGLGVFFSLVPAGRTEETHGFWPDLVRVAAANAPARNAVPKVREAAYSGSFITPISFQSSPSAGQLSQGVQSGADDLLGTRVPPEKNDKPGRKWRTLPGHVDGNHGSSTPGVCDPKPKSGSAPGKGPTPNPGKPQKPRGGKPK